ncbi:MAG: hypothetical protein ABR513_08215, partial [Desulfotignum sp.]
DVSDEPGFDMHQDNSIRHLMADLVARTRTPVVTVVDGGRLYDPLRDALMAEGVPVFQVCDQAVAALALYIQGRLRSDAIRSDAGWTDMKKEEA